MDIQIKQELRFYKYGIQLDEHHDEKTFMTVGKPPKTMQEIQKEAEDEFYYAVINGIESNLNALIFQKLTENGYQELEYENGIYYNDYEMNEEYVKDVMESKKGHWHYEPELKKRLVQLGFEKVKAEEQKNKVPFRKSVTHWRSPELENTENPFDPLQNFNEEF